jgi:hypothetical protein
VEQELLTLPDHLSSPPVFSGVYKNHLQFTHKKTLKGQSESVYRRTQWPKEKVHKVKQRSTKHIYKTKDRKANQFSWKIIHNTIYTEAKLKKK